MTVLSVSVVSYRTPALLERCLAALAEERARLAMDVIVVDNGSNDGSADLVEHQFPWVRLIRNHHNAGFAAAHNQALKDARGRYWLILNSDTVAVWGSLRTLIEYLDLHPTVAIAGPKLRHPDGSVQPSRRRFPTIATLFLESTQLQRFWPDNAVLRRYYVADRSDDDEQDVDWLVGACLCVRAEAVRQVGLFDERFFMYSEELDWARRVRAAGWRITYVPTAEVQHLEGGSSRADLLARDRMFQSSKLEYVAKWHGPLVAHALRAYLVLEYVLRAAEESLKIALRSRVPERRQRLRVISSGLRSALRFSPK